MFRANTCLSLLLLSVAGAACAASLPANPDGPKSPAALRHYYFTNGVHNDKGCHPPQKCLYPRKDGEPSDPLFPDYWSSEWTMYRVFQNYDKFPPPYAMPPANLSPSDYQISYGSTWYDASWTPPDKDGKGAMMEYYQNYCLPIFPMKNNFSCAFVSLGNKAYFLRYADRPPGTPACCQFSLDNHPPRQDFIKHLPYSKERSERLNNAVQAYAIEVGPQKILFGYAFDSTPTADSFDPKAAPYRHPQSFYFSGYPGNPPDAPIVSQNYMNFRMQRPDPKETWDQVPKMCPPKPEWCCLFESDCPKKKDDDLKGTQSVPEWSSLQPSP